ncbi:hypothetical protein [Rhizobium laguerreae]|uniref:hypothetical protein n=1 Tax=Rhizobium laguerreae TaxID=1076926 RepID=UPI001441B23A|nr:hypothetical protein [Rhizobium laguerreae]NKN12278.1 hypothetical protein [Rhizobium laguerreae]
MKTVSAHAAGDEACDSPNYRPYFPFLTLKCVGRAVYRSREARNYACLLDLDPSVVSWRSLTYALADSDGPERYHVDFFVEKVDEHLLVEVCDRDLGNTEWVSMLAKQFECRYQAVLMSEIRGQPRLQNAKDLLRYAGYDAALGDRIRILAALDELGSLTLAECLSAVRDGRPMQTVAAMILTGHVEVDLDKELLGPDTVVRRASR